MYPLLYLRWITSRDWLCGKGELCPILCNNLSGERNFFNLINYLFMAVLGDCCWGFLLFWASGGYSLYCRAQAPVTLLHCAAQALGVWAGSCSLWA